MVPFEVITNSCSRNYRAKSLPAQPHIDAASRTLSTCKSRRNGGEAWRTEPAHTGGSRSAGPTTTLLVLICYALPDRESKIRYSGAERPDPGLARLRPSSNPASQRISQEAVPWVRRAFPAVAAWRASAHDARAAGAVQQPGLQPRALAGARRALVGGRLGDDRRQPVLEARDAEALGGGAADRRIDRQRRRRRAPPRPAPRGRCARRTRRSRRARTLSRTPPSPSAITGRPAASASTAAIPNSSVAVTTSARAPASSSATCSSGMRPVKRTFGPASRRSRRPSGPSPITTSGSPSRENASTAMSIRLCAISSASTT